HKWPRLSIAGFQLVITCPHLVITEYYQRGRDLYVNNTVFSLANSCTLLCMALHSGASRKHTHSLIVKHTQHTVNHLITPDVNPFLPSAISTGTVLYISTDHCIGVTGDVNDTKSVPSFVRMPTANRYKSL
ncbi:unnamed protein product, partial [Staurois parvus]